MVVCIYIYMSVHMYSVCGTRIKFNTLAHHCDNNNDENVWIARTTGNSRYILLKITHIHLLYTIFIQYTHILYIYIYCSVDTAINSTKMKCAPLSVHICVCVCVCVYVNMNMLNACGDGWFVSKRAPSFIESSE